MRSFDFFQNCFVPMIRFIFLYFLAFEKQPVNRRKTENFQSCFHSLPQKFIETKVTSEFALPLYPDLTFLRLKRRNILKALSWRFFLPPNHYTRMPLQWQSMTMLFKHEFLSPGDAIIKSAFFKNRFCHIQPLESDWEHRSSKTLSSEIGCQKAIYAQHQCRHSSDSRIAIFVNFSVINIRHENGQNGTIRQKHK